MVSHSLSAAPISVGVATAFIVGLTDAACADQLGQFDDAAHPAAPARKMVRPRGTHIRWSACVMNSSSTADNQHLACRPETPKNPGAELLNVGKSYDIQTLIPKYPTFQ